MILVLSMLWNQRVYLRPEGLSCQWFLVKNHREHTLLICV